jgi:hypothetical protein
VVLGQVEASSLSEAEGVFVGVSAGSNDDGIAFEPKTMRGRGRRG